MVKENKIGFIGLGAMGFPMAKRLCQAGFSVLTAINSNPMPAEELKKLGATIKSSFSEVIINSDVIMSILPADQEVKEVLLSDDVLKNIQPGTVLIEMTSCTPKTVQEVASLYRNLGVRVIDAPVSGGISGAKNGTLTMMVGGSKDTVEDVEWILREVASKFVMVGDVGAGKAIKMINQMLVGIHVIAASEAISLARHLDVDLNTVNEVISESTGSSKTFHNKFRNIVSENYDPGFRLDLMLKDIEIALQAGKELSLPLTTIASQFFKEAAVTDNEKDMSAVSKTILHKK